MKRQAKQINIAVYWFECILHMDDPLTEWPSVERQFNNADDSKIIYSIEVW